MNNVGGYIEANTITETEKAVKVRPGSMYLSFYEALEAIMLGRKATKGSWQDPNTYLLLSNDRLCIHHAAAQEDINNELIVHKLDIEAKDWFLI